MRNAGIGNLRAALLERHELEHVNIPDMHVLRYMVLSLIASFVASAQGIPPANQFVYTSGTTALPSSLTNTPNLLFNRLSGLSNFENVATPTKPTVYIRKGAGQHGLDIFDNNPSGTTELNHGLNIELYNITSLAPGAATNDSNFATQGLGIESISWGLASYAGTEGDANHTSLGTIGAQFNHYTTGSILSLNQGDSIMTGDFIYVNAAYDGNGSLQGNFLDFNAGGITKFKVNSSGNVVIPAIKASSGTRFVCVDTNGTLISRTTPCSGT